MIWCLFELYGEIIHFAGYILLLFICSTVNMTIIIIGQISRNVWYYYKVSWTTTIWGAQKRRFPWLFIFGLIATQWNIFRFGHQRATIAGLEDRRVGEDGQKEAATRVYDLHFLPAISYIEFSGLFIHIFSLYPLGICIVEGVRINFEAYPLNLKWKYLSNNCGLIFCRLFLPKFDGIENRFKWQRDPSCID